MAGVDVTSRTRTPLLGDDPQPWLRTAAPFVLASVLLVLTSGGVLVVAWALQVAEPGSAPVTALRWFDVNSERNVPTAWSAFLLLGSAVTAALLVLARSRGRLGWLLVSAVAAYLALDEGLELHERLNDVGRTLTDDRVHFAWVVPGAVAAAAVGLVLLRQLRSQSAEVRRRLVLAGVVYLSGAVVVEVVSGQVLRAVGGGRAYVLVTSLEEGLEMAGAALLLAALLCELREVRRSRAASAAARA